MTASFLSGKKQYESFTLKYHYHYHQLLQKLGCGVIWILWICSNWIFVYLLKHKNKSHWEHNINNLANIILFSMEIRHGTHTEKNDSLTRKFVKNHHIYGSDVPSETYPASLPHLETSRIYLTWRGGKFMDGPIWNNFKLDFHQLQQIL